MGCSTQTRAEDYASGETVASGSREVATGPLLIRHRSSTTSQLRLRIGYVSRGLSGAMRVPVAVIEGVSKLHTDVFIGYPKPPAEKNTSAG